MYPSLTSCEGMRNWKDKLLLWATFLSTSFHGTSVDCMKINELPSPNLNSSMNVVRMGQNVSLSCSSKNVSVDITYSLFLGTKHLETKRRRADTVIFHLKIFNANETGPYKCKTNVSNQQKYSQELSFKIAEEDGCPSCLLSQLLPGLLLGLLLIILVLVFLIQSKHKKGKAQKESTGSRDVPMQGGLYANVCETQAEAGQPQELHYATPVFKKVAPREQAEDSHEEEDSTAVLTVDLKVTNDQIIKIVQNSILLTRPDLEKAHHTFCWLLIMPN